MSRGGDLVVLEIYKDFKQNFTGNLVLNGDVPIKQEDLEVTESKQLTTEQKVVPAPSETSSKSKPAKEKTRGEAPKATKENSSEPSLREKISSKILSFVDFQKKYKHETVYEQMIIGAYYLYLKGEDTLPVPDILSFSRRTVFTQKRYEITVAIAWVCSKRKNTL